jgi:hypothetical protein
MFELTKELKDEHLWIDTMRTKDLEYCLISFCSSKTPQRIESDDNVAIKIRGAFGSVDDAMEHARALDGILHTYVAELYKWILIGNVDSSMSQEHHLVDMIRAHKKRNRDAREEFQRRKDQVMKDGLDSLNEGNNAPAHDLAPRNTSKTKTLDIEPIRPGEMSREMGKKPTLNDRDRVTIPGLNYAVISVVERDQDLQELETPRGVVGVKIRGVFETREQAESHMEKLGKIDTEFDMFLAELYRFHMLPPDIEKTEDVKYRDDYLNKLFTGYKESKTEAMAFQAERDMMEGVERLVHPAEQRAEKDNDQSASSSS